MERLLKHVLDGNVVKFKEEFTNKMNEKFEKEHVNKIVQNVANSFSKTETSKK